MKKKENLRKELTKDLLGKIPLFFVQASIVENNTGQKPVNYVRVIDVEDYYTSKFQSRGYHKPISKMI